MLQRTILNSSVMINFRSCVTRLDIIRALIPMQLKKDGNYFNWMWSHHFLMVNWPQGFGIEGQVLGCLDVLQLIHQKLWMKKMNKEDRGRNVKATNYKSLIDVEGRLLRLSKMHKWYKNTFFQLRCNLMVCKDATNCVSIFYRSWI